ncbi:MAG: alanine--tRNA ligase [Candidatus Taylorbacteria bacterium]
MNSSEIRERFLEFFRKRGHAIISSASLVTTDEKGITNPTLFNTAGMQPLIPYLLGKPHPKGRRIAGVQKCLRTIDIDDVGDKTHGTFFEMLGNWSLGDYFKKEAITWSYEFLTEKKEGLGLDPKRLYITVFAGDKNAEKDIESAKIWEEAGIPKNRIYFKDASSNWWPAVKGKDDWTGPSGPCSEMFYDITEEGLGDLSPEAFAKADEEQKVVEIWNDVFMEFEKVEGKIVGKLKQKNVDTGAGFERLAMVMQRKDNIFDTDLLLPVLDLMKKADNTLRNKRIIADHLRASVFLIADGVIPSNTDRGYILRRLIRRAIINTSDRKLDEKRISAYVDALTTMYEQAYPELVSMKERIQNVLVEESSKFAEAVLLGIKEFEKISEKGDVISGTHAFNLFSSYGLPIDMTIELAKEKKKKVDVKGFEEAFKKHQELSRAGAEKKFKGGLADHNEHTVRLHTAHHLLLAALQSVLGKNVKQRGSNITEERLRIDFSFERKLSDEEKKKVEETVNNWIQRRLAVVRREMSLDEAKKLGAEMEFGAKYPDKVSVYFIEDEKGNPISKEFCGGPHVKNTSELAGAEGKWKFKIVKEEAVSQGVRRIKAVII